MLQTIEQNILPERFRAEGLGIIVCKAADLPDPHVQQLCDKARQPHMLFEAYEDVTGDPGRLRDIPSYRAWTETKERTMYLLVNEALNPGGLGAPDIGTVTWFSERENELAPGRPLTWAIRSFAEDEDRGWQQYQGRRLGSPFMQVTFRHFRDNNPKYQNHGVWLDLVKGNPAEYLYDHNGFKPVGEFVDDAHGETQIRTVMVNDTALMLERAA